MGIRAHAQTLLCKTPHARPTRSPSTARRAIRRAARSWTALMWAAHRGHVDVMVALMHGGADQSKRVPHGRYSGCALAAFSCVTVARNV
jgi:hypothetical protein